MTDTKYLCFGMNTASHAAVADQLGKPLEPERWRGNIWLDGLPLGPGGTGLDVTFRIGAFLDQERIARCAHTAWPRNGRDADTLGALRDGWTRADFGVYAAMRNDRLTGMWRRTRVL
jgi:hypothetical protein